MDNELTPEQQVAKLQSELEQANAKVSSLEKTNAARAKWGEALKALRDNYPDHYRFAEASAFGREAPRPDAAPVEESHEEIDPQSAALLKQMELMNQKMEHMQRRIDRQQAESVNRAAKEVHPDFEQHQDKINEILEQFPSLAASPLGMDLAATYAKRDVTKEQVRKATLEEVAQKENLARGQFVPEPDSAQAPGLDLDSMYQDGDTVHSALDRAFPS